MCYDFTAPRVIIADGIRKWDRIILHQRWRWHREEYQHGTSSLQAGVLGIFVRTKEFA